MKATRARRPLSLRRTRTRSRRPSAHGRLVLVFILLLAIAGLFGWAISQSAGYVLVTYDRFRYESSFWVFLALIGCLWLLALAVHCAWAAARVRRADQSPVASPS